MVKLVLKPAGLSYGIIGASRETKRQREGVEGYSGSELNPFHLSEALLQIRYTLFIALQAVSFYSITIQYFRSGASGEQVLGPRGNHALQGHLSGPSVG
jgi:hypothetical protein